MSISTSLLGASETNNNKSVTRSKAVITVTYTVSATLSKRRTLTLTQSIVVRRQVANALGAYLSSAFDFASAAGPNGPCAALPPTIAVILFAAAVGAVGVLAYRRFVRRVRPVVNAETARPLEVLLRENVYIGVVCPCHFHCWWVHIVVLLVHLNLIFLVVAYVLYAFQGPHRSGLLSGTSGIGVVAAIIGAAVAHTARPLLDAAFYFVTYDAACRDKCQNEEGLTWLQWHARAERHRLEEERQRRENERLEDEHRKQGAFLVQAAMLADINESGWEEPAEQGADAAHIKVNLCDNDEPRCTPDPSVADAFGSDAAVRQLALDIDIILPDDDLDAAATVLPVWRQRDEVALAEIARLERLDSRWKNPLKQPWWGPVETQHLLAGAACLLAVVALLAAYQSAVQLLSPNACDGMKSPLPVALLLALLLDAAVFEPLHQSLRLVWRYLREHEGHVDYSTTWTRRLSKLIVEYSVAHPYRGQMSLWPEKALVA